MTGRHEAATARWKAPRLMVVADLEYAGSEERLLATLGSLAPVAADPRVVIQLRAKHLDALGREALIRAAQARLPADARMVVNGTPEVAARAGVGVHWPERGLPDRVPSTVRWHSAAAHSLGALRRAERAGVDAVVFGAVFDPGSKTGTGAGLEALRVTCDEARVPVIAIGGITPERARGCIEAGAYGIAVVSGILAAADPLRAAEQYLDALASNMEQVEAEQ